MEPTHNFAEQKEEHIVLPSPTAWPITMAFGFTLLVAGLITAVSVTVLGAILFVVGCIGLFFDLFPREKHVEVALEADTAMIATSRQTVERLDIAPELPRALLPLETYPVSAGIKGGLAGGVAMAVLACLYGVLKQKSLWYPINLLAATIYTQSLAMGPERLYGFHWDSFLIATLIHVLTSVLVGLLYGAMLPMISRHPIFLGGVVAPVLWSGLLRSILDLLNPLLKQRVDWTWFIASQFAFGIVAGLVVVRQHRIPVKQFIPWAMRAGIEARGAMLEKKREDQP